jgi:hypothetical protein
MPNQPTTCTAPCCAPLRIWTSKVSRRVDENGRESGVAQTSFGEWIIEHCEFFAEWIVKNNDLSNY